MGLLRSLLSGSVTKRQQRPSRESSPAIVFLTDIDKVTPITPNTGGYSDLASTRLRVLIPARELSKTVSVAIAPLGLYLTNPEDALFREARAIVIGKLSASAVLQQPGIIDAFERAFTRRKAGPRPTADVSDNYGGFTHAPEAAPLVQYLHVLGKHCRLIAPCEALREVLSTVAHHGVDVIEDPWESPVQHDARWAPGDPLRLVWFGNLASHGSDWLASALRDAVMGVRDRSVTIEMLTGATREEIARTMAETIRAARRDVEVRIRPWSLEATWDAMQGCDAVLLPQDTRWDWGRVKSHNRFVESLRAGRFVVASPIPSYRELERFGWVNEDLGAGLRWALEHPSETHARIADGQTYIARRFAPEVIGERWKACLG